MSFKDLISYVIKRFQWYMETPKNERRKMKHVNSEKWSARWFGMLPFSMKMTITRIKKRLPNRK